MWRLKPRGGVFDFGEALRRNLGEAFSMWRLKPRRNLVEAFSAKPRGGVFGETSGRRFRLLSSAGDAPAACGNLSLGSARAGAGAWLPGDFRLIRGARAIVLSRALALLARGFGAKPW